MKKNLLLVIAILASSGIVGAQSPAHLPGSGNNLTFNGSSHYIDVNRNNFTLQAFTVDMWVNPGSTQNQYADIIDNNHTGTQNWVCQQDGSSSPNGYIFYCLDGSGVVANFALAFNLTPGIWQHLTLVKGTNMEVYVNGIQVASQIAPIINYNNQNLRIGYWYNNGNTSNRFWNGSMDEVRIWNIALTQTQIRDRMCHKITNADALYANLYLYYNYDEASGTLARDGSTNATSGTLVNNPSRSTSPAPIGDNSAYQYVTSGLPAGVNLSYPAQDNFSITYTGGSYSGTAGAHVYVVNEVPNTTTGITSLGANDRYFGVFSANITTPVYTAVYNYTGNPYVGTENDLALFKRNNNSAIAWTNASAILNTVANTLTVTGQTTEYILGHTSVPLPVKLLSFTGTDQTDSHLLQWQTGSESIAGIYEVQSSTDGNTFTTIGKVNALSGARNYNYTNKAVSGQATFYYRLRLINSNGNADYSTIVRLSHLGGSTILLYPNPVTAALSIHGLSAGTAIRLLSMDGRTLKEHTVNEGANTIDMSSYQPGIYNLQYIQNGKMMNQKVMKD